MAGVIQTGNHPKALWPGVYAWWGAKYDEHPEEYVHLFDSHTSRKNYEEDVQQTGFGLAPIKRQGAPVTYDTHSQGFITRYIHVAYALGYIVTREELDDNLYNEVSMRRSENLAFSMRQTMENVGANIYNRAFDPNETGGDGVSLLNNAHPNTVGGGAFSNVLDPAADLSEAALEDMIIQIYGARNDRGLKISLKPRNLIVPRHLYFEANRILGSTLQNDTANNAVNVLKAVNAIPEGIVMNHYLTDPNAWFMRTNAPHGLKCFKRTMREFSQDNDFDTMNAKAKAYERYSFGWTDPRGLYGSPGA